ncbi:DUF2997 domain-containing protein [Pseudanabaena sp. FACHB-1998]|uniref:DUF2997 domain-containing protein n=1 Tax=Pseudanabaena sp. FACHB-1998 TaxID=2692858 RepID=UPI0016802D31|nr:DUF2997 domain-containing protein [Pseudanabaena sp. FACHB-1998]MBD2175870.1 DUF2997 domain-containing protein [Pseudanabaena sp. FACHB-1998]
METLEFIIYPDGRVEERVTGIVGSSCAEVTAAIEAQLGIVAHRELTSENFAQQQVISQSSTQLDRVSDMGDSRFSQW